jgi:Trk-type K+ transport system membrane component
MWLIIAIIVVIAAIGFVVLALAMQWREFSQKANGQD